VTDEGREALVTAHETPATAEGRVVGEGVGLGRPTPFPLLPDDAAGDPGAGVPRRVGGQVVGIPVNHDGEPHELLQLQVGHVQIRLGHPLGIELQVPQVSGMPFSRWVAGTAVRSVVGVVVASRRLELGGIAPPRLVEMEPPESSGQGRDHDPPLDVDTSIFARGECDDAHGPGLPIDERRLQTRPGTRESGLAVRRIGEWYFFTTAAPYQEESGENRSSSQLHIDHGHTFFAQVRTNATRTATRSRTAAANH
jgi:hypothetical protein